MAGNFRIFRILCLTSPELETEREVFQETITRFGEHVTFPDGVLFAPASFPGGMNASKHRAAAASNIRICNFLIQIAGPGGLDAADRELLDLAVECAADPSLPMQRAAVFLKGTVDLTSNPVCDIATFADAMELERGLWNTFTEWYAAISENAPVPDTSDPPQ
jgi:hypothetical protein